MGYVFIKTQTFIFDKSNFFLVQACYREETTDALKVCNVFLNFKDSIVLITSATAALVTSAQKQSLEPRKFAMMGKDASFKKVGMVEEYDERKLNL